MSNEDQTEYQTESGRSTSKKLSMQATTPPADVPGYRLERFLGSGAFGQVWVGRDLNTGRPVAIKFFLHRGGVNWTLLSHEVKNLVQLSADRHIVQVLEVGWDSDPPFYVMELVTGGSLEDELTERGAFPVSEAVALFRKICVGLNHSHSKGVLHCDLKPANILLGEDHEPRLADFGQSRMTHDQSPSLGTLFYMAPEQANLESTPSSSWDVYAVGAIMYRMLTGGPPYRDDSIIEQLDTAGSLPKRLKRYRESIQQATPPSRHVKQSGVDRELARIVTRCLAADPEQRFTNVQEILDSLDRRAEIRARRPLVLLGTLGPILLLIATGIFAARTINRASEGTKQALRREAYNSNDLAAKFAARTLESELERYFRLCRDEMDSKAFRDKLDAALADPELSRDLKIIADQGTSERGLRMVSTRESLLDNPQRMMLDRYLSNRLTRYTGESNGARIPRLASMFVTDSSGTIFGIAYDRPVPRQQNSSGRNYAYRTYFHGRKNDLPKDTPIESIEPLGEMHLSAAFQSTATGLWKVAISAPVYLDDASPETPDAVFVVTINLGDFELLQGDSGANLVAVLVEAREGEKRGTVLQHPYLEDLHLAGKNTPGEAYKVDAKLMDELLQGGDVDYLDPVAAAEGAEAYAGQWIAAMQPVALPVDPSTGRVALADRPDHSQPDHSQPDHSQPDRPQDGMTENGAAKDANTEEANAEIASSENTDVETAQNGTDQPESGEPEPGETESGETGAGETEKRSASLTAENQTDLLVLVQYRLKKVFAPVAVMQRTLLWEGASALISILAVCGTLWFFVRRIGDDRHFRGRKDDLADAPSKRPSTAKLDPSEAETSKPGGTDQLTETQHTPLP